MFDQAIGGLTLWGTVGGGPVLPGLFGAWAAGTLRSPAPAFELPSIPALSARPAIAGHGGVLTAASANLGGLALEPEVPSPARAPGPEEADGPPWGALPLWFVAPTGVLPIPPPVPAAADRAEWISPGAHTRVPQVEFVDAPGLAAAHAIDPPSPSRHRRDAGSDPTLLGGEDRAEPDAGTGATTEPRRENLAPPLAPAAEYAPATHGAASEIACALIAFHASPSAIAAPAGASRDRRSAPVAAPRPLAGTPPGLPSTRTVPVPEAEASPLPEAGPPAVVPPSAPGAPPPSPQYPSRGDSPYPGERSAVDELRSRSGFQESARVGQLPRGWQRAAGALGPHEVWNLELTERGTSVSGAAPLAAPGDATVEPEKTPRTGLAVPLARVEPPVREARRPGSAPDRAALSPDPAGPDRERSGSVAGATPVPLETPGEDAGPDRPSLRAVPPKDPEPRRESSPGRGATAPPPVSPLAPLRPLAAASTAVRDQGQAGGPPADVPASPRPGPGIRMEGLRLRLEDPAAGAVDIHVAERRGAIQVSVRSADAPLAAELRRELPPLIERLDRSGFEIRSASAGRGAAGPEVTGPASGSALPALSQAAAGGNVQTGGRDEQRPRRSPPRGWLPRLRAGGAERFSLAADHSVREVTR